MEKLTYKQAFDLITEAYIKGEIKPFDQNFCFCGTLCGNSSKWFGIKYKGVNGYKGSEFLKMETALLKTIAVETGIDNPRTLALHSPKYEDALFSGMCAALEVLRDIHLKRGEDVGDFIFTKRSKVTQDAY